MVTDIPKSWSMNSDKMVDADSWLSYSMSSDKIGDADS